MFVLEVLDGRLTEEDCRCAAHTFPHTCCPLVADQLDARAAPLSAGAARLPRTKAEIHQELSGTPRGLQGEADMSLYLEASQEGACGRP